MIRSDQKVKGNARIQKKGFDYPAGEKAIPIFSGYSRKQNRPTLRLGGGLIEAGKILMPTTYAWIEAPVLLLMALLFLVSGTTKVPETTAIQAYMHVYDVPVMLVWPAAVWESTAGALFSVRS